MKKMRNSSERGFTLIELLTVIIIIGILAAVAIPVFSSQRSRAQDSQTVSDVRNIVTSAETYLADRTKSAADLTGQSVLDYASSKNVKWDIRGNSTTGGYCIAAFNESGKDYNTNQKLLTYDSTAGGLKKVGGSCGPAATAGSADATNASKAASDTSKIMTPSPSASTAVGSDTVTPITFTGTLAPNSLTSSTASSPWAFGSGVNSPFGQWILTYANNSVYVGGYNSNGIYRITTNNPGSSTQINNILPADIEALSGRIYYPNGANLVLQSGTGYGTVNVPTGIATNISEISNDGTNLYVGGYEGKIYKVVLNAAGDAVASTSVVADFSSITTSGVSALAIDSSGNIYAGTTDGKIMKNNNLWKSVNTTTTYYAADFVAAGDKLYYAPYTNSASNATIRAISYANPNTDNVVATISGANATSSAITTDGTYLYATVLPDSNYNIRGIYRF